MKMYRCSGSINFFAAVEAASLAEAERKIDAVLGNAVEVTIREGLDQEFTAAAGAASRSRVQVEN